MKPEKGQFLTIGCKNLIFFWRENMNEDKAVCSCMRVKYDPIKNDNGTMTERWKCSNCGREFRKKVDSGYIDIVGKPGTTKRLRTATVKIDIEILFDLMGIPFFLGQSIL